MRRPSTSHSGSTLFLLSCLALGLLSTTVAAFPRAAHNREEDYVPNSFIVKLAPASTLSKRGISPQTALKQGIGKLRSQGKAVTLGQQFVTSTFSGATLTVANGVTADDILAMDGVERVFRNRIYRRLLQPETFDSVLQSILQFAQSYIDAFLNAFKNIIKTASPYANDQYGPHVETGVDQLHNANVLGQGVKVCVIDEGIDYKNPILGGCFGPGCLVSFGYDLVGDNWMPGVNNPVPDPDPYATCTDHGSHVTGIIAAQANQYGFTGVAPKANFGFYRVFSCVSNFTSDDQIVAALIRANSDGCQVINLSLGGAVGWESVTPSEMVIDSLAQTGVHVVSAAGNEGPEGLFYAAYTSSAMNGVSAGSVDVAYLPTYQANLNAGLRPIAYMSPKPLPATGNYPVIFTSPDGSSPNDACAALPAGSLTGAVAVIKRGACAFTLKQANAAAAGAAVVLIYNDATESMIPQLNVGTSGLVAVAALTFEAGTQLMQNYNANPTGLKMTFPAGMLLPAKSNVVGIQDKFSGGLVSSFSTYTPTFDMFAQPAVAAPGGNILSTVSLTKGGVGIMRGTSQAAPLVAGVIALILQARAGEQLNPFQVRSLLSTTADRIPTTYGGSTPETVVSAGSGLINAARAVSAKTLLTPYQFMLNDTAYANYTQTLIIRNTNSWPVQYTFSSIAGQAYTNYANSASQDVLPSTTPGQVSATASTSFSKNKLTVPGGQTSTVSITFTPPPSSDRFPVYSGLVAIEGRNLGRGNGIIEQYTVPYFGLAAKMIDMPILDTTNTFLGAYYPFLGLADGNIASGGETISKSEGVTILFRLAGGTRKVLVDLVTGSTAINATIPAVTNARRTKRNVVDFASMSPIISRRAPGQLFSDIPTIGNIYSNFEAQRDGAVTFSDTEYLWNGNYTNANNMTQFAASGAQYKVLLRMLKITADPILENSYESWLSPEFTLTD